VIRGNWVLRNVIGVPAPDPPANVPALPVKKEDVCGQHAHPDDAGADGGASPQPGLRGLPQDDDPIGFALEPFDAIGHLPYGGSGQSDRPRSQMYDGTPVTGPAGVTHLPVEASDQYLPQRHRESDDVRAGTRHGLCRHARGAQKSCRVPRRTATSSKRLLRPWRSATTSV